MKDVETIKRNFDNSGGISKAIYRIDDKGQTVLVFFNGKEGDYDVEMITAEIKDGEIVTEFADGWRALQAQPRSAYNIVSGRGTHWKGHVKPRRGKLKKVKDAK